MLKRIISMILCMMMTTAGLQLTAFAAESESDYRYLNMVELGIISADESENYIVTRGEFASVICSLFVMTAQEAFDYALNFSDIDANDTNYKSIKYVVAMNLFSGYPDYTFRSNEPVTVEQALKVLVSAAGFADEAEARGGFPYGYITVAKDIGLLKRAGIPSYGANIKRRELGILLFNLMITPVNDVLEFRNDTVYYKQTDETFAEKYLNLSYITDVFEANDYTNLSKKVTNVSKDNAVIGGITLKLKQHFDRFMAGRWVSVFYDEETMEIASITERKADEDEIILTSKDITSINSKKITADTDGKSKTYTISPEAMIVYNDMFVMSCNLENLKTDKDYRITLLDNNGAGEYNVVLVENYTTIVVSRKDSDKNIYDKLAGSEAAPVSVNLDDSGRRKVLLYNGSGDIAEFDDITENTVVTVIENTNYVRAYISKTVNTDTVLSYDEQDGQMFLKCESGSYFVTPQLEKRIASSNILNRRAEIYLDVYGDAAYIALKEDAEVNYGYLVKARMKSDTVNATLILKIFTAEGKMVNYETSDKIKINNTIVRTNKLSDIPTEIENAQPVCYTLSENRVKKLETAKDYLSADEDGFFKGASLKGKNIAVTTKVFGGVIEAGKNTVAFIIPNDIEDDEAYKVKIGNNYESRSYNIDAYYKSKESEEADILVITSNVYTLTYEEPAAAIVKIGEAGINGETYKKVTYFCLGAEREAYVKEGDLPSVSDLGKGDAVRIKVDAENMIKDIEHIYDYDLDKYKLSSNPTSADFNDGIRRGMGYIARVYAGRVRVSQKPVYNIDSSVFAMEMHKLALYDIIIVDSSDGDVRIYSGKEANIDIGNKVVYVTRSGGGKALVIYK